MTITRRPPLVGEHNQDVYLNELGLKWAAHRGPPFIRASQTGHMGPASLMHWQHSVFLLSAEQALSAPAASTPDTDREHRERTGNTWSSVGL